MCHLRFHSARPRESSPPKLHALVKDERLFFMTEIDFL
jgi:hypothetical protein